MIFSCWSFPGSKRVWQWSVISAFYCALYGLLVGEWVSERTRHINGSDGAARCQEARKRTVQVKKEGGSNHQRSAARRHTVSPGSLHLPLQNTAHNTSGALPNFRICWKTHRGSPVGLAVGSFKVATVFRGVWHFKGEKLQMLTLKLNH